MEGIPLQTLPARLGLAQECENNQADLILACERSCLVSFANYTVSPFEKDLAAFVKAYPHAHLERRRGGKIIRVGIDPGEVAQALVASGIRDPVRFLVTLFVEGLMTVAVHAHGGGTHEAYLKGRPWVVELLAGTYRDYATPHHLLAAARPWTAGTVTVLKRGVRELVFAWAQGYSMRFDRHAAEVVLAGLAQDRDLQRSPWSEANEDQGLRVSDAVVGAIRQAQEDFSRWSPNRLLGR